MQPFLYNLVENYNCKVFAWNDTKHTDAMSDVKLNIFFEEYRIIGEDRMVMLIPDLHDAIIFEIGKEDIAGFYFGFHDNPCLLQFRSDVTYFTINIGPAMGFSNKGHFINQVVSLSDLSEPLDSFDFDTFRKADFEQRIEQFHRFIIDKICITDSSTISCVLDFIEDQGFGTSLDAASRHCGYSSRQIRNIFHEQIGISPKQAIQIVRFQRALEGMMYENCKMKNLAQQFGFYDEAHFDKYFKKYMFNLLPGQFSKIAKSS